MIPLTVAEELRQTLLDYLDTTFAFRDDAISTAMERFLTDPENGLFKGPFVHIRLPFERAATGAVDNILDVKPPFTPFAHQLQAFKRLASREQKPQHTLVTTGTGSGKSECFLYPILDHCARIKEGIGDTSGLKAVLLYPMNALAEDQARRVAEAIHADDRLRGKVTAGMYVGGTGKYKVMGAANVITHKPTLRKTPPDILLTNYKMLDYLLMRSEDKLLWEQNTAKQLVYIVLDEVHSYDGAQGSDVACLLRRLYGKLERAADSFTFVGTSATLSSSAGGEDKLVRFARQLSGADIDRSALIGEQRVNLDVFIGNALTDYRMPRSMADLKSHAGEAGTAYARRQCGIWFDDPDMDPLALGDRLRSLNILQGVLAVAQRERTPIPLSDLIRQLAETNPSFQGLDAGERMDLLQSLLAMVAHAERADGARRVPFLQTQIQVWVRALSRIKRKVQEEPEFTWDDEDTSALPSVYCRECGVTAWFSRQGANGALSTQLEQCYRVHFDHKDKVRYFFPPMDGVETRYLDVAGLMVTDAPGDGRVAVADPEQMRKVTQSGKDLGWCPCCETEGALALVGSAAASLASVAVSHLYASPLNADKKLLAFTDSVQDACHRAGFFEARTYRFNLRTAVQTVLEESGETPLSELPDKVMRYWTQRFVVAEREVAERRGRELTDAALLRRAEQRVVATLVPPDLNDDPVVSGFLADGSNLAEAYELVRSRLEWEIVLEYGLNLRVGRTLDKTRCSTAWFDADVLDAAVEGADAILTEEIAGWSDTDALQRRQFIDGFLLRLKRRGATYHSFLYNFLHSGGGWYHLTKGRSPYISIFSRETPRPKFLSLGNGHAEWDSLGTGTQGSPAWLMDWGQRCFGKEAFRVDALVDIYRALCRGLVAGGVLRQETVSGVSVVMINPEALVVYPTVASLRCGNGDDLVAPVWAAELWSGMPSLGYRAASVYVERAQRRQSYYQRIFRSGNVQRIYSREHTGMLKRNERDILETRFKLGEQVDAPNLLTCTPTLEMGIDIGDLSAAMICSVPPEPTNYLQRVGRAGRKTGNALIVAVADATPHDRYFFQRPMEMIAGDVTPPGCFLDAPEMLARQFTAYCLDRWFARSGAPVPGSVGKVLELWQGGGFPKAFLDDVETDGAGWLASFLDALGEHVGARTREQLVLWQAEGRLRKRLVAAILLEKDEDRERENTFRRLTERKKKVESERDQKRVDAKDAAAALDAINSEWAALKRQQADARRRYTLTWLGEIGILPNYDLPDDAVKLITTVRHPVDVATGERPRAKVQEFMRGSASALRDFAPGNHFYASARRFDIDQLAVGSTNRELVEVWRFCPDCHFMQLEDASGDALTQCKKCGCPGWKDAGQVRKLVRLRKVFSRIEDADSRFHDLSEVRVQNSMVLRTYFGIESTSQHAVYAERLGFGWEYFSKVLLREVNFGLVEGNAELSTAGETVASKPFRVCVKCGVSLDADEGLKMEHRRNCTLFGKPLGESSEPLGTYREAYTEAIRFLLPVALHDLEAKRATLEAAFKLGLRKVLGGRVDHLQLATMVEPAKDKQEPMHQYLVLFDSVTGGTGYLEEFASDRTRIQAVLDAAYRALTQCVCGRVAGADGCYQCLFQYRNQREQGRLSRMLGIEQLRSLSAGLPALVSVDGLSGVTVSPQIFESELERLFLEAMHDHSGVGSVRRMFGLAALGTVAFGGHTWELECQQDVGRDYDDIDVASRPDITLRHVGGPVQRRDVHIFCDGYKYHVGNKPEDNRVPDDIYKRQSIMRSGSAFVVTLVWDDLVVDKHYRLPGTAGSDVVTGQVPVWLGGQAAITQAKGMSGPLPHGHSEWFSLTGMDLLVRMLGAASDVDVEQTGKLALASMVGAGISSAPDDRAPLVCEPALEYQVRKRASEWGISASVGSRGGLAFGGALAVLHMDDVYASADALHSFQRSWKEWWRMVNLLGPSGVLEVRGE